MKIRVVKELDIKQKESLGQGAFHTVYPNKLHPDQVIKTKTPKTVDFEGKQYFVLPNIDKKDIEAMKDNPDLFAKVLKYNERWAILEKLDTESIQRDLDILAQGMIKMFINQPKMAKEMGMDNVFDVEVSDIDPSAYLNYYRRDKVFIKAVYRYCKNRDFLLKLITLIRDAYKRVGDIKHSIDIKYDNIGYDKGKNIKILDI